jgi:hypothetical protein
MINFLKQNISVPRWERGGRVINPSVTLGMGFSGKVTEFFKVV